MRHILLLLAFSFFLLDASAQTSPPGQNLVTVGLTSPEVASLGKFGNVPVSYSTGVPNITIPIYEINVGGIKLPISLDYHSGGVRVDEVSSSVGIGWALNAGGAVSRAMLGYPDEAGHGYLNSPPFDLVANTPTDYGNFLAENIHGLNDAVPDVFSYNIIGESGKFIIKKSDGSFIEFPATNNRIENYNGNNYKITDKNGTAYIFEQKEATAFSAGLIPTYTSAWRLTKIISNSLADTVYLTYDVVNNLYQHSKTYSHTIGTTAACTGSGTEINADNYNSQTISTDESYLTQINWRGGQISFNNVADRTDRAGGKRVSEIDIYAKFNGALTLIKQAKLIHSYFYYVPPGYTPPVEVGAESEYRLRLDAVKFYDIKNVASPQVYTMTYDNTPMAPRETAAQDIWGFNNGHFENSTLMPVQTVAFDLRELGAKSYYTFGNANRSTDVNYIKACSIQSIKYPTGGTTVFALEPHQYNTGTFQTIPGQVTSSAQGGLQSSVTVSFTVTSIMQNFRYHAFISAFSGTNVTAQPRITVTDQATGQTVLQIVNLNASQSLTTGIVFLPSSPSILTVGHTYNLTTNIYTTDASTVSASIDILYETTTTNPIILSGGGLRVNTITNYDNNGNFINQKSYNYNGDGIGTLLTPYNYLTMTTENFINRTGCSIPDGAGGANCVEVNGHPSITYFANSVVPVSQFTGSPVLYGGVTEYDVSAAGVAGNGKKVYGYQIYQDQQVLAYNNYDYTGVQMISNVWKNGFLTQEDTYKSNGSGYTKINSKTHTYTTVRQNTEQGLHIKPKYAQSGCHIFSVVGDVTVAGFAIPYAAILLQSDADVTIDDNGNQVVNQTNYYYDDATHILPTKTEMTDSKADNLVSVIKYPHDLASPGNVYQGMLARHIISPVVSYVQSKNATQETSTNVNYFDWFADSHLLLPQSVSGQILANPAETRVNFNNYDLYGNILQQRKTEGPYLSYIWGYNQMYPVAEVTNASRNDIFYDSFEEGNGTSTLDNAKTGHYSFNGVSTAYSKTLTGLDAGTYTLSYWKKTGTTWSLIINTSVPVSGSTYPIAIAVGNMIDDVRFYPSAAQMTTYTYDPLVGMTSGTDAKNMVTYYEYDGFQRLVNVKDKYGNIIKHLDYHYQGL